jgi:hypothetical protein
MYPPQTGSDAITQSDSIINEPEVSHVSPGRTEIRITGAGEDLFVVDGARAVTASAGDIFPYVNIIGSLRIEHANGPTGDSGRGIVIEDNLVQSLWGAIEAVGTNGHGFYDNSATYQCVFNHIGVRQTNPRSEGTTSAVQFNSGGAPYNIEYLTIYPYDDGASNVEGIRYDGAANPQIGTVNMGGATGTAVNAALPGWHGVHIDHINYEPSANNGDLFEIVNQASPRPFYLGGLTLFGNTSITTDKIIRMGNSTNVHIPQPAIQMSNLSFTDVVRVDSDTQTAANLSTSSIIYEGESGDINNNTGSALTEPIACVGDFTLVN